MICDINTCQQCQSNYCLFNNFCIYTSVPNCLLCDGQGNCLTTYRKRKLAACIDPNCISCLSNGECDACNFQTTLVAGICNYYFIGNCIYSENTVCIEYDGGFSGYQNNCNMNYQIAQVYLTIAIVVTKINVCTVLEVIY